MVLGLMVDQMRAHLDRIGRARKCRIAAIGWVLGNVIFVLVPIYSFVFDLSIAPSDIFICPCLLQLCKLPEKTVAFRLPQLLLPVLNLFIL